MKLPREKKVELLAQAMCKMVGIEPFDSMDGSANWFMFGEHAEKLIADLEGRGFQVWDWIELVEKTPDVNSVRYETETQKAEQKQS